MWQNLGFPDPACSCGCATGPACHACALPSSVTITITYLSQYGSGPTPPAYATTAYTFALTGSAPWFSGCLPIADSQWIKDAEANLGLAITGNGYVRFILRCAANGTLQLDYLVTLDSDCSNRTGRFCSCALLVASPWSCSPLSATFTPCVVQVGSGEPDPGAACGWLTAITLTG